MALVPYTTYDKGPLIDLGGSSSTLAEDTAWQATPCAAGTDTRPCQCAIHEKNSGLWFQVAGGSGDEFTLIGCDFDPALYFTSCQQSVDNLVTLADEGGCHIANLVPGWLQIALGLTFSDECEFDAWALVCDPWIVVPYHPTPIGAPCPPGQALNSAGQCVPVDPPLPRGVRNLSGPTVARNPTTQGAPTPFAMTGCGCGVEDETEVLYDPSATPTPTLASVSPIPNAHRMGGGIARVPRVRNRARVLARARPVPPRGFDSVGHQPSGPPTGGRNS